MKCCIKKHLLNQKIYWNCCKTLKNLFISIHHLKFLNKLFNLFYNVYNFRKMTDYLGRIFIMTLYLNKILKKL